MDPSIQGKAILCTILYDIVLTFSTVSSQSCTTAILDPQNGNTYDPTRLTALLGRHTETHGPRPEQWIFPNLQFTCNGRLTKWIFRGVPGQAPTSCRVEFETWRLDSSSPFSIIYEQQSTTNGKRVTVRQEGPIFTYDLATPVQVQRGDTVGVATGFSCVENIDNNILSWNISGNGSSYLSYRRDGSGFTFYLRSPSIITEQDFVPLIEAVVEPLQDSTGSVYVRTNINVSIGRVTIAPGADQPGGTPVITIAAAAFGGVIGVLFTAVVCVCMWCIARHICTNKKNQNSNASKQHQKQQQDEEDGLTNVISMQQNEAYKQTPYIREPTVYDTVTEIPEPAVQLNPAYGRQSETCEGIETEETEDEYERMYSANCHVTYL